MRAKMKYICKKFINHQIKKCLLFRCRHAFYLICHSVHVGIDFDLRHDLKDQIYTICAYFWDSKSGKLSKHKT
jgi:hypothetical protein